VYLFLFAECKILNFETKNQNELHHKGVCLCQLHAATLKAVGACGGEDKDFGSFPKESGGGSNKI
jgi:hypothetical protein